MASKSPFRAFPLRLKTDERFRLLSLEAKGLLLTLALHAELTGMKRFSPGVLRIESNAESPEQLNKVLDELERAGWVVTDGDAYFVPELLAWSPQYRPANENHRPGVENSVESILSPTLVEAFWDAYPEWRSEPPPNPRRRRPVDADRHGMRDGIGMAPGSHSDGNDIPPRSDRDPGAAQGAISNTKTDSSHDKPPTSIEYARALAAQLNKAQAQNASLAAKLKPVKADAAAATELQNEGVALVFALEMAAEMGLKFRPDAAAEQILSTRYVNKAIIEAWSLVRLNTGVLPLKSNPRRRGFRSDDQAAEDQAANRNPEVQAKVRAHMARLDAVEPGTGDRWLAEMKATKPADRWLYPFALEMINATTTAAIKTDHPHEARGA